MTDEKKTKRPRRKRIRRTPEEARTLILDTATKLLAKRGPDAVGPKEVAREAGVSRTLILHYFGTFEKLVQEALSRHMVSIRQRIFDKVLEHPEAGPELWIDEAFSALTDPMYGRLFGWSLLSGRSEAAGIFARRERGLQKVAYFVRARIAGDQRVPEPPSEEELEFIIMLVATAAFGYSTSREGLWGAFGKHANAERDLQFRRRLASLVVNLLGIQDPEDNEDDKDK